MMCETAIVRGISIHNPWAMLIVNGVKDIENRSWQQKLLTPEGEWLVVHASLSKETLLNSVLMSDISRKCGVLPSLRELNETRGCAIGVIYASSFISSLNYSGRSKWCGFPTRTNFIMTIDAVRKFEHPVPMKGFVKLFQIDKNDINALVLALEHEDKQDEDGPSSGSLPCCFVS